MITPLPASHSKDLSLLTHPIPRSNILLQLQQISSTDSKSDSVPVPVRSILYAYLDGLRSFHPDRRYSLLLNQLMHFLIEWQDSLLLLYLDFDRNDGYHTLAFLSTSSCLPPLSSSSYTLEPRRSLHNITARIIKYTSQLRVRVRVSVVSTTSPHAKSELHTHTQAQTQTQTYSARPRLRNRFLTTLSRLQRL